jgi:thiazole tautomerase (transcriptional regulator TenI)
VIPRAVPRLHVVTDDRVLARPDFASRAGELLASGVVLHLRGPGTPARHLFELGAALAGGVVVVNDRVDVARALGIGAHLAGRSLPAREARALVGTGVLLGRSVRGTKGVQGLPAPTADLDYLLVGTLFRSGSHPGRPADGVEVLERVRGALDASDRGLPLVAIGGITPERVPPVLRAGAHGVAVLGGIWNAAHPMRAADRYVNALNRDAPWN